jgi:multidrug efflux pump subunit AcrB
MMWLVRLALQRPYTFVVMAILIVILGVGSIFSTPVDIFPAINIPVISAIWSYIGLLPDDMEKRIVLICERAMTTAVDDIQHIESRTYPGIAVIRVYTKQPWRPESYNGEHWMWNKRATTKASTRPWI